MRWTRWAGAGALVLGAATAVASGTAGTLDGAFGTDGVTLTTAGDVGGVWLWAKDAAVQPDGRSVVVGSYRTTRTGPSEWWIARYGTNGALDATFGSGGIVRVAPGPLKNDEAEGVAVAPGGTIYVAGRTSVDLGRKGTTAYLTVRAFRADGTPETGFGGGMVFVKGPGKKWSPVAGGRAPLAILPDGRILVGSTAKGSANANEALFVARLNADGTADTTFGGGTGCAVLDAVSSSTTSIFETVVALAVAPDGGVIGLGDVRSGLGQYGDYLVRWTASGQLDSSFDDHFVAADFPGMVTAWWGDGGIAVQADGRFLVATTDSGQVAADHTVGAVIRYEPDGSVDTTYGTLGVTYVDHGEVNTAVRSVAVDAAGRAVVAAQYEHPSPDPIPATVHRLAADGSPDTSFGPALDGAGELTWLPLSGSTAGVDTVVVDSSGRYLLVGSRWDVSDEGTPAGVWVSRYLSE